MTLNRDMPDIAFSKEDQKQLAERGISEAQIRRQLDHLQKGCPALWLDRPATVGDGIRMIAEDDAAYLLRLHRKSQEAGEFRKFVPASGAASRMFEMLLEFDRRADDCDIEILTHEARQGNIKSENFLGLLRRIKRLAFYEDLRRVLGRDLPEDVSEYSSQDIRDLLKGILGVAGLNYGQCPKGLVKFHRYADHCRTAFEEHLAEGVEYLKDRNHLVRLHFTVSPEHEPQIRQCLNVFQTRYHAQKLSFDISYSFQKPSTDTIALDGNGQPLRDAQGRLVFRPGGHGALLENLQALNADMVFIKNIDNITPDSLKEEVVLHQKILGGYLMRLRDKIFLFLNQLDKDSLPPRFFNELEDFCVNELMIQTDKSISPSEKKEYFHRLLNRPVRVCGMVRNEGEPGGGPFWVKDSDGGVFLQIVESSQVDKSNPAQQEIWNRSTHFNPVDLVCAMKNYRAEAFDLKSFVDAGSGLVTSKAKEGQTIKVLEWPGLWNGSMAQWMTVFVEVPAETFTPVKTVLDLLRPEHQN